MTDELAKEGKNYHFAIVNATLDKDTVQSLVDKVVMPIFQDTKDVDAWKQQDGKKDDFYVYDAKGKLFMHLPMGGKLNTDLGSSEGFGNVKKALLDAAKVK